MLRGEEVVSRSRAQRSYKSSQHQHRAAEYSRYRKLNHPTTSRHSNSVKREPPGTRKWSPCDVDIINLHHLIRCASSKCIAKILVKLQLNLQRILLSTYLMFLFWMSIEENRNRFIPQKKNILVHRDILNHVQYMMSKPKRQSKRKKKKSRLSNGNICGRLSVDVLSHCLSFLDQSSRLNASKVSIKLHSATIQPLSRNHLCINKKVRTLILENRDLDGHELIYESIDWNESYNRGGPTNPKSLRFRQNLINLFTSKSSDRLRINTAAETKHVLETLELVGIRNVERLIIDPNRANHIVIDRRNRRNRTGARSKRYPVPMEIPFADLHRLKYIECGMNYMQSLWLDTTAQLIPASQCLVHDNHYISDVKRSLISSSEIREIRFHCHHSFELIAPYGTTHHPIYWLWNIPKLELCQLRVTINSDSEFVKTCNAIRHHSIVRRRARQQKLKTLVVLLDSQKVNSVSLFVQHIRALYPNLESLTIHQLYHFVGQTIIVNTDWMLFRHLKEIKLELPHIRYGIGILESINSAQKEKSKAFENLEVLHLLKMRAESSMENGEDHSDHEMPFITDSISTLTKRVYVLIKYRPTRLCSVNVDLHVAEGLHHRSLIDTYFRPHLALITGLIWLVDNLSDVYDGYLRVNIPLNNRIYSKNKAYDDRRKWSEGHYIWDSNNVKYSCDIVQNLKVLHDKIKKCRGRDGRTVLDLPGLDLTKKEQKTLESEINHEYLHIVSHQHIN